MNVRLLLLCGLLLAGASRARAEDPPPSDQGTPVPEAPAEPEYDAADLNHDGTTTKKEKRQKRRADRRARRAANSHGDDGDSGEPDAEQDAAAAEEGSSRGAKAS